MKKNPGSFSPVPHRIDIMNTQPQMQPQMSMGNMVPKSAMSAHMASGKSQDRSTIRYVDRQREAQGVHGKTWTGELKYLGEGAQVMRGSQRLKNDDLTRDDDSSRGRPNFTQQIFATEPQLPRLQAERPLNGNTQPGLEHQKSSKKQRNWPFLSRTSSSRTAKPHRASALQRRNAQRRAHRGSDSPNEEQISIGSDANRANVRFYQRIIPKDVKLVYPSPAELARRKGTMPQIEEVAVEFTDSDDSSDISASPCPDEQQGRYLAPETTQFHAGVRNLIYDLHREVETGARKTDEDILRLRPTPDAQNASASPKRDTLLENGPNITHSKNEDIHPKPRKFPLVVRAARQTPTVPSPPTPPLSTSSAQVSTPAPGPESDPFAQDGSHCGTPGCTWADCLRIRGTSKMMDSGAADEKKSEGGSVLGEAKDEVDIVSTGDGFAFLRLN